jgi:5-dehydro-4-deoxyglucarate dehydratase
MTTTIEPGALRELLQTVIGFPVTPFDETGEVDLGAFEQNLSYMVDGGVNAMVIAGGTGELYSLTENECRTLYAAAAAHVGGRATLIAGVGFGTRTASALARSAQALGLSGVMIFPPYYGAADQEGLYGYYRHVAESTALGVFPYARDQTILSPSLLLRLADLPNMVAYKDGRGDLRHWNDMRAAIGDRLICLSGAGDDLALPFLASGAVGFTSSVANYDVGTPLAIFEACRAGHYDRAFEIVRRQQVLSIYSMRQRKRGHEVTVTKKAMDLLGRKGGSVRPPLVPLQHEESQELARLLQLLPGNDERGVALADPDGAAGART